MRGLRAACRGWRRRQWRALGAGKERDASPTAGITCPHGGLLPEAAGARAKRVAVPPAVWAHLAATWRAARASSASAGGGTPAAAVEDGGAKGCCDGTPEAATAAPEEPPTAESKR